MALKISTTNQLMDALLDAVGCEPEPSPADGWAKLSDMIVKMKTERGLSDPHVRRQIISCTRLANWSARHSVRTCTTG